MSDMIQQGNGFVLKENGELLAEVTYRPRGEHILVLDHTYVAPAMRGQKLAEELVKRVVEYARETNKKIVPACSYAYAQFRRHKDYADVWQRDENV